MTTDFSKGSPTKLILSFAVPYLIGNLFQLFYNIADTVIVGQILGVRALAAVGATSSLVFFAHGILQSLTTGFSAVVAQKFGAKDETAVKRAFANSIVLGTAISLLLTTFCCVFAMPILKLMNTPADIIDMSYNYIIWIFAGLFATMLFNLLSNMIRALGDSKTPLCFLIIACIINIILDFCFIILGNMGTKGAGIATVIAQFISGICCIVYIVKRQPLLHFKKCDLRLEKGISTELLKTGIPMAFLNMVISISGVITTFVYNGLNTLAVAAYTAAGKIEQFVIQPLLSIGSATAVFVAQNHGANEYGRIIKGIRRAIIMSLIWVGIASVLMIFAGKFALNLVVKSEGISEAEFDTIINNGYIYIVVNTILSVILTPLIVIKNSLQALSRATMPIISGFTEIIGRASTALTFAPIFGFTGVAFANPVAWLMGLIPIAIDYFIMKHKLKKLSVKKSP